MAKTEKKAKIDDVRILATERLVKPAQLISDIPHDGLEDHIAGSRGAIHRILKAVDDRLMVVVGPCSIHDRDASLEYAKRLAGIRDELPDLLLIMRVYFEKPRTTVGWKGLINDPELNGSFKINDGLRLARSILLDINKMGLPCGTEYLDVISPQYFSDLVSWGAIGARTTESQIHRELASGLSCPVGFKNGTDGNVRIAADAVLAAASAHHFLSMSKDGTSGISATAGNEDCHVILRGGNGQPNYDAGSIASAAEDLSKRGLQARLMVDCSHANSGKDYRRQPEVCSAVAKQIAGGDLRIFGLMIESNLVEGRQDIGAGELVFGQSVTDSCSGWDSTAEMLRELNAAAQERRKRLLMSE